MSVLPSAASLCSELAGADDPSLDFCLWPYESQQPRPSHALRGVSILRRAAEITNCGDSYSALIASVQRAIGAFQTVWGVKWNGADLSSELYFYDYARLERKVPFSALRQAMKSQVAVADCVDDAIPYFMLSVEAPMRPDAFPYRANSVDLYIGNPGSSVSSGICYELRPGAKELKNFYFFFNRASEWEDIKAKLACSAQIPPVQMSFDDLLLPWLTDCRVIVVANKRNADALYLSGIDVDQLVLFLRHFRYPPALIGYVDAERSNFRHLQFDVGFDFRLDAEGRLRIQKSGFYNVF